MLKGKIYSLLEGTVLKSGSQMRWKNKSQFLLFYSCTLSPFFACKARAFPWTIFGWPQAFALPASASWVGAITKHTPHLAYTWFLILSLHFPTPKEMISCTTTKKLKKKIYCVDYFITYNINNSHMNVDI